MKSKLFSFVFALGLLVFLGYEYFTNQVDPEVSIAKNLRNSDREKNTGTQVRNTEMAAHNQTIIATTPPPQQPGGFATSLNQRFKDDLDANNPESNLITFINLPLHKYETVKDADDALGQYLNDKESYPVMRALIATLCKQNSYTPAKNGEYRNKIFHDALKPRCNYLTQRNDPFWDILALAREGDEYMQLYAPTVFGQALRRYSIKYYIDPMEYMLLRDEVFAYQESLAAKGVVEAANTLYREYRSDRGYLAKDHKLAYYYGNLAILLGEQNIKEDRLNKLMRYLTTEEIDQINRKLDVMR